MKYASCVVWDRDTLVGILQCMQSCKSCLLHQPFGSLLVPTKQMRGIHMELHCPSNSGSNLLCDVSSACVACFLHDGVCKLQVFVMCVTSQLECTEAPYILTCCIQWHGGTCHTSMQTIHACHANFCICHLASAEGACPPLMPFTTGKPVPGLLAGTCKLGSWPESWWRPTAYARSSCPASPTTTTA